VLISGPGIAGSVHPTQVTGGGSTYTVTFASPLTKGGSYAIQLSSSIADLAGNTLGPGVADNFQLTADTTPPIVSAVTPSGPTRANVGSLTVAFNEAIDPTTFTPDKVVITAPSGPIPTSAITVTPVDAADFTVTFPQQTQEATYNVSVGPGILDTSGNALAASY